MDRDKRLRILECAANFFSRFGFRKTSIAEIATEAGVAKGTVYLAADSKRDLFYQVLHRQVREGIAYGAQFIDPRRGADELLSDVVAADLVYFDDKPLVRQLLVGHASQAVPQDSDQFDELRRLARGNLLEVLRLGVRQGVFRDDLQPEVIAELIQDLQVTALMFHAQVDGIGKLTHPRWETTLALLLRGLRPA